MRTRRFKQVDVFTRVPYLGNPVAVVLEAEGLDDAQMQRIAGWTNLSETTFVLPPPSADADYRLRIFTPRAEIPFAGHPTLGSAHAVLEAGVVRPRGGRLRQACGAGLVTIAVEPAGEVRLWLASPQPTLSAMGARLSPNPHRCRRRMPWSSSPTERTLCQKTVSTMLSATPNGWVSRSTWSVSEYLRPR